MTPHGSPVTHYTFESLEQLSLSHLSTSRHCPGVTPSNLAVGPFHAEASSLLAFAGIDFHRLAWARQVHANTVACVGPAGGRFADGADILVTDQSGVGLSIFTADCLAIVLYEPVNRVLAVAHSGWRGTVRDVPGTAVAALRTMGARPESLWAVVAPSIGPCCYEVDAPVIREFHATFPGISEHWMKPVGPAHVMLDLWGANEALLERAGVDPSHIENPRRCTACHRDELYSYRKGDRGRLVTVAALR